MKDSGPTTRQERGFSLIELLVVIAIIGVLAGIAMPTLRGLFGSDKVNAAATQLADDLSFARNKAIGERSTVYVVFVSPSIITQNWSTLNADQKKQLEPLITGQFNAYTLYSKRSLGDQPGPGTKRFLTEWQRLPEGLFINPREFDRLTPATWSTYLATNRPFVYVKVPFPTLDSPEVDLPAIGFNYQGQLVNQVRSGAPMDEYIYISQGALAFPKDAAGKPLLQPAKIVEKPTNNWTKNPYIKVDWLTGRARVEHRPIL